MPSGAKKRKAARHKREKQEKGKGKDKERVSIPHPPVSPANDPLPSPPPPPQTQGNGLEDRMPHDDGGQSESGEFGTPSETPFATPLSHANHPLAEEAGEESPGSQRVAVDLAVESSEDGYREADELDYRVYERAEDDAAELQVETVAAAADEVVAAQPYDLSVKIVRSHKGEPREAEGAEGTEMKKPAEESVIAVEQIVLTREEGKQEKEVPAEILKESPAVTSLKCELKVAPLPIKDEIKEQPSYKQEVKVVPLPGEDEIKDEPSYEREAKVVLPPDEDEVKERPYYEREGKAAAVPDEDKVKDQQSHEREVKVVLLPDEDYVTGEQLCMSGEASQGTRKVETVPSTEVAPRAPVVVHHARWWNCCGLLDVLVGFEK